MSWSLAPQISPFWTFLLQDVLVVVSFRITADEGISFSAEKVQKVSKAAVLCDHQRGAWRQRNMLSGCFSQIFFTCLYLGSKHCRNWWYRTRSLPHLQQYRLLVGWRCLYGFPSSWGLLTLTSVPLFLWHERLLLKRTTLSAFRKRFGARLGHVKMWLIDLFFFWFKRKQFVLASGWVE